MSLAERGRRPGKNSAAGGPADYLTLASFTPRMRMKLNVEQCTLSGVLGLLQETVFHEVPTSYFFFFNPLFKDLRPSEVPQRERGRNMAVVSNLSACAKIFLQTIQAPTRRKRAAFFRDNCAKVQSQRSEGSTMWRHSINLHIKSASK